jgi:hypothetical protein
MIEIPARILRQRYLQRDFHRDPFVCLPSKTKVRSCHTHPQSKNLQTPGRASGLEDRVCLRGGAGGQLLHAQRALQLPPGEAAEVNRAKRTDVTTQLGRVVGALDAIGTNPPAAAIPRAKFLGHRDDHGTLCLRRPCRQRSLDVEEAYPDAVAKAETEAARFREQQKHRMIERQQPGFDACHPVDVQQISPDGSCRRGRCAESLDHRDRACLEASLECPVHPVEGVGGRPPSALEYGALQIAAAAAPPFRIGVQASWHRTYKMGI